MPWKLSEGLHKRFIKYPDKVLKENIQNFLIGVEIVKLFKIFSALWSKSDFGTP